MNSREQEAVKKLRHRLVPFTDWLKELSPGVIRRDLLAGLTVAVVLIPQSMAYAMLAGLPPHYGLYAAAVTPAIAALWGSLRQLATGPIAIMSLLVFTTLSPLAEPGSERFVELAFMLSFMVGTIYLVVGLFGMGFIMSFISHPTVRGFSSAAALIIISTQLPNLLGISVTRHEDGFGFLLELASKVPGLHPLTFAVGATVFLIIYGIKRSYRNFPAALLALVLATLAVRFFDLEAHGVAVIGNVPAGLPSLHLPHMDAALISELLGPAIVIALVSFAETYAVGKAISEQTKQRIDVNQEFFGQGMANLAGSLFQCYPVSGSFSRTAMNYASGAKTGLSSIISSAVVVMALLFLTPLLRAVPRAALAALVISAVMLLFHPREVFALWKKNRHDGVVAVTVFVLTLMVKPDYALLIGVIISLVLFLWVSMHPRIVPMAWDPKKEAYLHTEDGSTSCCPQTTILRVDNAIYFANAEYTVEHLLEHVDSPRAEGSPPLRFVLLDFKGVGFMDITGVDELNALLEDLRAKGMQMHIVSLHLPVHQVFVSTGFLQDLGEDAIHTSYHEAMAAISTDMDHDLCGVDCPSVQPGCMA